MKKDKGAYHDEYRGVPFTVRRTKDHWPAWHEGEGGKGEWLLEAGERSKRAKTRAEVVDWFKREIDVELFDAPEIAAVVARWHR
jgi:hypothetical protein